ncbi:MAG: hypothetical protein HQK51_05170 [Oligoflexia bacterium]|nr:hypothetical protein [Oligoflexia bacterium]
MTSLKAMILKTVSKPELLLIFLLQAIVIFINSDFIPIWDSTIYIQNCIQPAITANNFIIKHFSCFGHTSYAFVLLITAVLYFTKLRFYNVHYLIGFFYILSTRCFYKILCFYVNEKKYRVEIFLATLIYAFCPLIWALVFNFNLDIGVLFFSILFFYSLIYQKKWQSLFYSIFLIFSKGNGICVFVAILFWYSLSEFFKMRTSYRTFYKDKGTLFNIKHIVNNFFYRFYPLILPVALLIWDYIYISSTKKYVGGWDSLVSNSFSLSSIFNILLSFNFNDPYLKSFLANIFILNFNWLLWGIIIFLLLIKIKIKNREKIKSVILHDYFFLLAILLSMVYITTRILTFSNPRYVSVVSPFLILVFSLSIILFTKKRLIRIFVLSGFVILNFCSNIWTIDPLSKKIYGTFEYGNHTMLNMTKISGECCGSGRDQLVYNMQYLFLQKLVYKLYTHFLEIHNYATTITGDPIFTSIHALGAFHFSLNIRRKLVLWNGTLSDMNWELPMYAGIKDLEKVLNMGNKKSFYYLSYPNYINDDNETLTYLNKKYHLKSTKVFENYGYTSTLYNFN